MRAFFVLLASVLLLAGPAAADVFTVRGVEVDETAASGVLAKEQAIAVGQQLAAQRLIERLTLPEDRVAVPPIDAGRAARLVAGFQEEESAITGTRYIGRLTVIFDPNQVRDLLEDYNIPYVLSTARPAVVVPLWRDGEETLLWGAGNPWFEAWSVAGTIDELVPVIAPSGDLADISVIDAPRALALDETALKGLAANYGVAHVLIALATPAGTDGQMTARLVGVDFSNGDQRTDYGELPAAEPVDLARTAAGMIQQSWKQAMVVEEPFLTTSAASVLFQSIDEWMALQGVIGSEPLVQDPRLDALTDNGALMTIAHRGSASQLAMALREHGAELAEAQGGLVIRSTAALEAQAAADAQQPPGTETLPAPAPTIVPASQGPALQSPALQGGTPQGAPSQGAAPPPAGQ